MVLWPTELSQGADTEHLRTSSRASLCRAGVGLLQQLLRQLLRDPFGLGGPLSFPGLCG